MKIKKLAAIILVFSVLLTAVGTAKAAEEPVTETLPAVTESSTSVTQEESEPTTETTDSSEKNEENPTENDGNAVAQMSICMRTTGFPAYFHVWIYIHNISGETVRVGAYDLPADEGVSIGSWGMTVLDSWGIYYNIEAYAGREKSENDYYTITKEIGLQELETVSEEITKWNYWDFFFNCTVFACRVWNCVGDKYILPVPLPLITLLQMAIQGAERGNLVMFVPDREQVCKQVGAAEKATLEPVDDRSIDSFGASLSEEQAKVTI